MATGSNRTEPRTKPLAYGYATRFLLRLAVHFDAVCAEPRAYFLAVWWRICGKRLRARSIMAPLVGQSRWAYRLWLAQGGDSEAVGLPKADADILLIALVEAGEAQEETLARLAAEGIPARLVAAGTAPNGHDILQERDAKAWVLPIAAGDILAAGAGAVYRAAVQAAGADICSFYADDDLIDARGQRAKPHFKPDWNAELYRHFDYVARSAILAAALSDLDNLPAKNWAAVLTARVIERGVGTSSPPVHLRRILHHRRTRPAPRLPIVIEEGRGDLPSISIIVPTRNGLALLRTCLDGLARTTYPGPREIVVIDNGSDDPATQEFLAKIDPGFARVIPHPGPFNFAAMNNRAVAETTGDLICFLNNDIEIRDSGWLPVLARHALREDVGAVGARLLYPDGRIQHAGVVLGVGGGAAHAHRLLQPDDEGYFHRHSLPQFVSAVTAACLVVERRKFLAVGGFDAANFAVAFNDVDLCLKLNARGWQALYEPRATLIHHESASRGTDRDYAGAARLAGELAALKQRWGTAVSEGNILKRAKAVDPFHHPSLSPFSERFVVSI